MTSACPTCRGPLPCEKVYCIHCAKDEQERELGAELPTLINVIKFMVRRELSSVGISAAALYRSIERWAPSIIVDEADKAFVQNLDLEQVVNSGWVRGTGVVRCHPDTHEPMLFPTFCMKFVASKGKQAPDTILSRAIFIMLKRRTRAESITHFAHIDDDDFRRIRSRLARWAADNGAALGLQVPEPPEGFINRLASNWQLLLAIADSVGAGKRARDAARLIAGMTDLPSDGVTLLQDIKAHFDRSTLDHVSSKTLVADLIADPEKPWAEWTRGKPISERLVAQLLREYGISSRNVGPRETQAKGYRKADFADAWARLLPEERTSPQDSVQDPPDSNDLPSTRPPPCNQSAFTESSSVHGDSVDGKENAKFPNENNVVDGWTDKGAKNGGAGEGICAQCNAGGEPLLRVNGAWLHPECKRVWLNGGIPPPLDRRLNPPALGPVPSGNGHTVSAKVTITERWPPPISSGPDDDMFDIS
jgi:Protein of unknown function (DUF3631)